MADRIGTIRLLTIAPGARSTPATPDDSVPDREALDGFRVVGVDQEPNRDDQEPNPVEVDAFHGVADDQEPNRAPHRDGAIVAATDPEALAARVLDHVWRIAQSATRHGDGLMRCTYEYTLAQVLVLRAIVAAEAAGRPALSASDVAHELRCSRANASELVAALVQRRSLTKRRDSANGRILRLYPTPDGRVAEYRARPLLADCARQVFGTLEGTEKQILVTLLEKVTFE